MHYTVIILARLRIYRRIPESLAYSADKACRVCGQGYIFLQTKSVYRRVIARVARSPVRKGDLRRAFKGTEHAGDHAR